MNAVIEEIYQTGTVRDERGNEYKLQYAIDRVEGDFLVQLIRSDPNIVNTVEVGCAYGLSSLFICAALSERTGARHTIIDPIQTTRWHGIGVHNLRRAGVDFFELIEQPSEFALPDLVRSGSKTFDMIFIDGWHTFDHTMLDLFYATQLVRVGGYVVVDDCHMPAVAKAISYFSAYPAYQLQQQGVAQASIKHSIADLIKQAIPLPLAGYLLPKNLYDRYYMRTIYPRMVVLHKVQEDERNWDWFVPF